MKDFLENIYGILFNPKKTIERIIETSPFWQAFWIIIVLSLASALLDNRFILGGSYDIVFFIWNLLSILLSSLLIWVTIAGFFEVTARIFSDESRFKPLLSLTGFALLPWILTAPLTLLKINIPLLIISSLLEVMVWIWSIVLIFLSVKQLYNLSTKKTWLFFLMPFLGTLVVINWISQFLAIFREILG